MGKDIFDGAKFGTPYELKNGVKVFYLFNFNNDKVTCLVGDEGCYGFSNIDRNLFKGKYAEPINEEELDDIASNWNINYGLHPSSCDNEMYSSKDVVDAFKYGYRKAKEE